MSRRAFTELPPGAPSHFRLHLYAALLRLRARLPETAERSELGFLADYFDQLGDAGFARRAAGESDRWRALVDDWESAADSGHLPLQALRAACGLGPLALDLLLTVGLVDEDARFGGLFEAMNGVAEPRPTVGLLATWTDGDGARDALHELLAAGFLETPDALLPRSRWPLQVPAPLWDALRGGRIGAIAAGARFRPAGELAGLDELVLPAMLGDAVRRAAGLLEQSSARPLVVRGPRSSGRRTIVAAVARELGRGVLELDDPELAARFGGPLASALHALPVMALDPAPGEVVELPPLRGYLGPRAVVTGKRGGIRAEGSLTLTVELPDPDTRTVHWVSAIGDPELARELGETMRIGSGTIRRLGELARAEAELAGRAVPLRADVLAAQHTLEADVLETLATRVPVGGDWGELAVAAETTEELALLERRCRTRERLREVVGPALAGQLTPGVRALFSGPSGTGKTLAARLLAAALGKDLYTLDLATVVNKYLGETEKNLDAVFGRAEELDVVLLLDEGDALMTRRTEVSTSNDRYANLETNFLLSRLESYEGILIVTTNAGERIDPAFRRRLDVVIDFRAPDAAERRGIWEIHLPPEHLIADAFLDEVALRCQLTGGQIRNAALHASLLALAEERPLAGAHVAGAVAREYRKFGGVCPLRTVDPAGNGAVRHG